jgi:hypothetical protein
MTRLIKLSVAVLILLISIHAYSQDHVEQRVIQQIDGKNPLQRWSHYQEYYRITGIKSMVVDSQNNLLALDKNGNLFRVDKTGEIINISHLPSARAVAIGKNGKVFCFQNYSYSGALTILTPELMPETQYFCKPEIYFPYEATFIIDHKERIFASEPVKNSGTDKTISNELYRFKKNLALEKTWQTYNKIGNTGYLDGWIVTTRNTLLSLDTQHLNLIEMNSHGELIRKSKLSSPIEPEELDYVISDAMGRLVIFPKTSNVMMFYSQNGIHLFNIKYEKTPVENFNISRVAFASDNSYYIYSSNAGAVAHYSPNGKFSRFILPRGTTIFHRKPFDGRNDPYKVNNIHVASDGKIYGYNSRSNYLFKLSGKGKVLKTFSFTQNTKHVRALFVDREKNIWIAEEQKLHKFSRDGSLVLSIDLSPYIWRNIRDFTIDDNENIYAITEKNLFEIKNSGEEIIKSKNPDFKHANEIKFDHQGNLYVADKNLIKKLRRDFSTQHEINVGSSVFSFGFNGKNQIYLISGDYKGNYFELYSPAGERLFYQRIFMQGNIQDVGQLKNGDYLLANAESYYDPLLRIHSRNKHLVAKNTIAISGTVNYLNNSCWMVIPTARIFIDGITPSGKKFFGAIETKKSFTFAGIPLDSEYRIWAERPYPLTDNFTTPVLSGIASSSVDDIVFVNKPLHKNRALISGRILDKQGHGINGAVISCGAASAVSNSYGCYAIALAPNQSHTIRVKHPGYKFKRSKITLPLTTRDKLYVDFQEKK